MDSKLRNWLARRPSLAGDSLPERIRSTTFALFGLVAAAGLVLVLLFARTGAPILSLGPLPAPPAGHGAAPHRPEPAGGGAGEGSTGGTVAARDASLRPGSATSASAATLGGGPRENAPARGALALGDATGAGAGRGAGGEGSSGASPVAVISPGQSSPAGPESVPVSTPDSGSPVSGSSSSSGLFVRSSVTIAEGEVGAIAEGSPVSSPEPETSTEPEIPVEPTPEPPAAPVAEPEAPVAAEPEAAAGEEPQVEP